MELLLLPLLILLNGVFALSEIAVLSAREARLRALADQGVVREWIAESRITLEALRLLVLKTAWLMDTVGNKKAMTEIQAIKIAVPRGVQQIVDRAIQLHGGAAPPHAGARR